MCDAMHTDSRDLSPGMFRMPRRSSNSKEFKGDLGVAVTLTDTMQLLTIASRTPEDNEGWKGISGACCFDEASGALLGVVGRFETSKANNALGVTTFGRLPADDPFWAASGLVFSEDPILSEDPGSSAREPPSSAADLLLRLLAACSPRAHLWLARKKLLPAPPGLKTEHSYLEWLRSELTSKNRGDLIYVQPRALPLQPPPQAAYEPFGTTDRREEIFKIRQLLWLLLGPNYGGDQVSAQFAAAGRPSRLVRNVVRFVEHSRKPIVLLGDPGSGKSTTLRQVAIRVCERGLTRAEPLIPIYVPLGRYRKTYDSQNFSDIRALVTSCVPGTHEAIRTAVPRFISEGRLLILFDSMDEMERGEYAEQVKKLSEYASQYLGRVRTVFACRINDFLYTFRHHQIVLLPFISRQISQYVHANFQLPVNIGGVLLNARDITRKLVDSAQLGDAATNPLMLYLIGHYVERNHQWPKTRSELFIGYLKWVKQELIQRFERSGTPLADKNSMLVNWAELAYQISQAGGGVYLEVGHLRGFWGKDRADRIVLQGLGSGILTIVYAERGRPAGEADADSEREIEAGVLADKDTIGFFHHRIQEFLCAKHLASNVSSIGGLNWQQLLDSPRWQETLIHLVSICGGDVAPVTILEDNLREIPVMYAQGRTEKTKLEEELSATDMACNAIQPVEEGFWTDSAAAGGNWVPPRYSAADEERRSQLFAKMQDLKKTIARRWGFVASDRERKLADRVVLTAQILGELRTTNQPLSESLRDSFRSAVHEMAVNGRPTVQVKMLLSWKQASDLIPLESLRVPLRSPISWVREQAIVVFGSLAASRKYGASSLLEEIQFDFAASSLVDRAKIYFKAAEGRWGLPLWALACYLFYAATTLGITAGAAWQTAKSSPIEHLRAAAFQGIDATSMFWLLVIAVALLTAPAAFASNVSAIRWYSLCMGWLCTSMLLLADLSLTEIRNASPPMEVRNFPEEPDFAVLGLPLLAIAAALFLSFWCAYLALGLPTLLSSRKRFTGYSWRSAWEGRGAAGEAAAFGFGLCALGVWAIASFISAYGHKIIALWHGLMELWTPAFIWYAKAALVAIGVTMLFWQRKHLYANFRELFRISIIGIRNTFREIPNALTESRRNISSEVFLVFVNNWLDYYSRVNNFFVHNWRTIFRVLLYISGAVICTTLAVIWLPIAYQYFAYEIEKLAAFIASLFENPFDAISHWISYICGLFSVNEQEFKQWFTLIGIAMLMLFLVPVGVVLGIGLLFVVLIVVSAVTRVLFNHIYWSLRLSYIETFGGASNSRALPQSAESWLKRFKLGPALAQAYWLSTVNRHNLNLGSDQELLQVIEQLESIVEVGASYRTLLAQETRTRRIHQAGTCLKVYLPIFVSIVYWRRNACWHDGRFVECSCSNGVP